MAAPRISVLVQPATKNDLQTIARISGEAFADDRHTQLKAAAGGYDHAKSTLEGLNHFMLHSDVYTLLKAVDESTNEILGSICWAFAGYAPEDPQKEDQEEEDEPAEKESAAPHAEGGENSPIMTPIQQLESITNADMRRWQSILMPSGTKCMIIVGISISPKHQGQGVGSALIRWGTSRADADDVFCWVHSSEAGQAIFKKHDFEVVGTLEVNLDDYAAKNANNDRQWGSYTFRYMKRLPKLNED